MAIKVDNLATLKPRFDLEALINQVFDAVPKEHTRGITKVVIVDEIKDPRLAAVTTQSQPVLYHPRTPGQSAYIELGMKVLMGKDEKFLKRWSMRMNLKSQIAGALLASIGQHYHLTFSHSIKKTNYEAPVRAYVEKHFVSWRDRNSGWRGKMFKPLQPYIERLDRWMKKKMLQNQPARSAKPASAKSSSAKASSANSKAKGAAKGK